MEMTLVHGMRKPVPMLIADGQYPIKLEWGVGRPRGSSPNFFLGFESEYFNSKARQLYSYKRITSKLCRGYLILEKKTFI